VIRLFMVSHPVQNAGELARQLIDQGLAACVHMLPKGVSVYRWDGKIFEEEEVLLMIKSAADPDRLKSVVLEAHPFDCPEIISLDVTGGHQKYLDWVMQSAKETP
jgi:periplasmic divalent cation tolerance protein